MFAVVVSASAERKRMFPNHDTVTVSRHSTWMDAAAAAIKHMEQAKVGAWIVCPEHRS